MIEWFINIKNKESSSFITFDIESFHPSISEDLYKSAIQFAKESIGISGDDLPLINQVPKTLSSHENTPWVKKEDKEGFDVLMGCFDGAEACERVNTYTLNQIKDNFEGHSLGVYRDDSLVLMKGLFGLENERIKKRVIKTFKDCKLEITIKGNLKIGNLLDMALNLHKNTYKPYSKPDDLPVYIDVNSNHPPTSIRELPKSIGKRLSGLSCIKKILEKAIPPYNDAFKKSGFKENLAYTPKITTSNILDKKHGKCNIICFNPPYSANVKTKLVGYF